MNNGLFGIGSGGDPATEVTNAELANMAQSTIKGRAVGAGTGDPTDLTATLATAILNTFTDTLKGLVPPSGGGTVNLLRADGTFVAPTVVPVASGTLSAQATLDIALGAADLYEIDLINVLPVTDNVALVSRFSQSAVFDTSANYSYDAWQGGAENVATGQTAIQICTAVGNASGEGTTFTLRLFRPSQTGRKILNWWGGVMITTGAPRGNNGSGAFLLNTNAIDGVQFFFSSGNIASGFHAARSISFT